MIKTVIISTEKQNRDRIAALLSEKSDIKILACGRDAYDALNLTGRLKPDIIIIDNQLDYIEGTDIPPLLKARSPSTMVVILAGKISDYQLYKAASNEVSGFINRETDIDLLPGILKFINRGGCYFSQALASRIMRLLSQIDRRNLSMYCSSLSIMGTGKKREVQISSGSDPVSYLSKKELNILKSIARGMESDDIANQLGLSVGTIRNNISSLMNKLGLKSRTQMVHFAFSYGIIPLGGI
jgi:DNA-binding NarL/FixJ family response regulator